VIAAFHRWSGLAYRRPVEWLAVWRILYAASQLIGWHTPPLGPLAGLGHVFFFPPLGPFEMLHGYPPLRVIQAVELGRDIALIALLVGYRTRAAGWAVGLTQVALAGLRYSTGKIDHEMLVFIVPVAMAFSSWGAALSVDARREAARPSTRDESGPALAWLALAIGLTYFTAGFAKALTGWLDPSASATRGYLLVYLRQYPWGPHALNIMLGEAGPFWAWKLMDYATVGFEMGVLFTIVRPSWFRTALTAALGFHLGVVGLLNIDFSRLIVCYLPFLFAPANAWLIRVREPVERALAWPGRTWPAIVCTVAAAYWVRGQRRGYPAFLDEWPYPRPWSLAVASVVVTLAYLVWRDWLGRSRNAIPAFAASPAQDEAGSRWRGPVFVLTALALPAQLACVVWASEPYPAPTGPLFMGNPDVGGRGRVFTQEIVVVADGERVPSDAVRFLGVPEPYATNIAFFRFPVGPVSASGLAVARLGWYDRLATQGHKFAATGRHAVNDRLSEEERVYLIRRFPAAAQVEVSWWREVVHVESGRLVVERTPLNRYRLTLR
jgi:hypothetical protein